MFIKAVNSTLSMVRSLTPICLDAKGRICFDTKDEAEVSNNATILTMTLRCTQTVRPELHYTGSLIAVEE